MSAWDDDKYCIACGSENPIGMKLKFTLKDDHIEAKYTFPREFQGYKGVVHGGMLSLLLDEVMVNLPLRKYMVPVVSVDIRVKLRKPLRIGDPAACRAFFVKEKLKSYVVRGEVRNEINNELVAEAEAVCLKVGDKI